MKTKAFLVIVFNLFFSSVQAAEVARGEIDEIANLIGSEKLFAVRMSATSSGPCAGQWVKFKEINFGGNLESYNFAFSMAATALVSGKKVRVHNYFNDTCDGVTFISIYK